MRRDDHFEEQLREVLTEIELDEEKQAELSYQEFVQSGLQEQYPPDEKFRLELLERVHGQEKKFRYRPLRKLVLVTAPIMIMIAVVMAAQAAGYNVVQFVTTKVYTAIRVNKELSDDDGWQKIYAASYLPVGYILISTDITASSITYTYQCNGTNLIIRQNRIDALTLDTEDADYKKLEIKGNDAFYTNKYNYHMLYLFVDQYSILIRGEVQERELIKIANGLT